LVKGGDGIMYVCQ
jgi:hypothetical protein